MILFRPKQLLDSTLYEQQIFLNMHARKLHFLSNFPFLINRMVNTIIIYYRKMYYQTQNMTSGGWPQNNNQYHIQPNQNLHQQDIRHLGLVNIGNTCYMNSVLQVLFDLLFFDPALINQMQPITILFTRLQYNHSKNQYLRFKQYLGSKLELTAGYQQQDAHQFLTGLLQILNRQNQRSKQLKPNFAIDKHLNQFSNWKKYCIQMKKSEDSQIIDLFGGELYTELRCPQNHCQYLFQRFLSISIMVPNNFYCYHLRRLMIQNFREETLEDITCDKCVTKTRRNKRSVIYNPPKILVVHLKRFQQGFWSNSKINTSVAFDEVLNLAPQYIHPDTHVFNGTYDLVSVVHHTGSLNGGHYYTHKKVDNQWLVFNDLSVTPYPLMAKDNQSSTAYIFFYKLR